MHKKHLFLNLIKYIIFTCLILINISASGKSIINIQDWTTKNGTRVLFVQTFTLPIVDIGIFFNTGSANDGEKFGLANFVGHMLGRSSKTLNTKEIINRFNKLGSVFSYGVNSDYSYFYLRCLTDPKILHESFQTVMSVLTDPAFTKIDFEEVKNQILASIQQNKQHPGIINFDEFIYKIYEDHPYGHNSLGVPETINDITQDDLRVFYNNQYTAKNSFITIAGNLNRMQAKEFAEQLTSRLPLSYAHTPPNESHVVLKKPGTVIKHLDFPSEQTWVTIGQIDSGDYNNKDIFALNIGSLILGGLTTSDLFIKIRENNNLVYNITGGFELFQDPGYFYIQFSSSTPKTQKAIDLSLEVLKNFVQNGPTEEQVENIKNHLINRFPFRFSSNYKISERLKTIGLCNLPVNYFDTYLNRVKNITSTKIKEAFGRHIDLSNLTIVTVGRSQNQ